MLQFGWFQNCSCSEGFKIVTVQIVFRIVIVNMIFRIVAVQMVFRIVTAVTILLCGVEKTHLWYRVGYIF